uniref:Reverse transcriptase domain-containing protein n=1 Tax=Tanacetum cinerariifolium TaxID=118510 RepID=A0A699HJT3_TANCI|nr:reverse transcriptase domain-containing protein [Tanacetum cinerariifolium]
MLVDVLLQHEVEGQVNRMVEKHLQNLLPIIVAQVGNHVNNQRNNKNQDDNVINDNNQGNFRTMNNGRGGCSYKEFMACNPKEYDRKGGAIVYTRWFEKMESVQDMSGCGENQKDKYTAISLIDKALTWWNSQVQTRGREAIVYMTWEDFKTLTTEEFCPNNKMQKLGTEFWCHTMVRAGHAAYTNRFHELDRLVPHLVTPENKRIESNIYDPDSPICAMVAATEPTTTESVVLKDGMLNDEAIRNEVLKKIPKNSGNNREPSRDGNARDDNKRYRTGMAFATTKNPVIKEYTGNAPKCTNYNYHHQPEAACPRLNRAPRPGGNHPNQAMAVEGGQCHGNNGDQARRRAFIIGAREALQDLNIVTGIDWLSRNKAKIVFHEKVVRIPLPNGKILRVLGDRPEEKIAKPLTILTQKHKEYVWGEEQERAFQTLKDKLCNALILALPDGSEDFFIYYGASGLGLGCVLMQKRKSSIKDKILAAQNEASEAVNAPTKMLRVLDDQMEHRSDRALYYLNRIWVPLTGNEKVSFSNPICKIGEGQLIGLELVQETTKKILQIKDRLKAARDRQKSYLDKRRKPLEFSVGDHVLLKVSPWCGTLWEEGQAST